MLRSLSQGRCSGKGGLREEPKENEGISENQKLQFSITPHILFMVEITRHFIGLQSKRIYTVCSTNYSKESRSCGQSKVEIAQFFSKSNHVGVHVVLRGKFEDGFLGQWIKLGEQYCQNMYQSMSFS